MRPLLLYIVICFVQVFSFAQDDTIDSLEKILEKHTAIDTVRVDLLNELSNEYFRSNLAKTLQYAQEADSLAEILEYKTGKAEALRITGRYFWRVSNYTKAFEYLEIALEMFEEISDEAGISRAYNNIGTMYHYQSDYPKALEYYNKALIINEMLDNKAAMAINYNNIGVIYRRRGDHNKALEYYFKSLELSEILNNKEGISMSYNNIGIIFQSQGDSPKALEYYFKSLNIKYEIGDKNGLAATYNNIGVIYRLQGELDKALENYQRALNIRIETGDKQGISISYHNIARIHSSKNNLDEALVYNYKALELGEEINDKYGISMSLSSIAVISRDKGDYDKALKYYMRGLELSRSTGSVSSESWALTGLAQLFYFQKKYSKAYENSKKAFDLATSLGEIELIQESSDILAQSAAALGLYEDAYEAHIVYKQISDSIQSEANFKKVISLEYQYNFEKEKELERLEQEKKDALFREELLRQKSIRNFFVAGFVLVLMLLAVLFYGFMQRRKKNRLLAIQKSFEFKQNFLANMSHEIRTPLIGVVGMIEILNKTELDNVQHEYLGMLKQSTDNLQLIINHVLDYSKIESGRLKLNISTFHFESLLSNAKELFGNICDRNIDFELFVEKDIPLIIKADQSRIIQIINNLVSNAVKFTKEGKVCINAKLIESNTLSNEITIKIEVIDTGCGIPKELRRHLFVPFTQIDQSDKRITEGAGLGLSICKELVQLHGGEIGYKTEIYKGSTFWFTFKAQSVIDEEG